MNRFDGYHTLESGESGVSGKIVDRPVKLCINTDYSETSAAGAWIMLQGAFADEHAQIGFFQRSGMDSEQLFTEWSREGAWERTKHFGYFSNGTVHSYKVAYDYDAGEIEIFKGSTLLETTPFDPAVQWTPPWSGFYAGETWDYGDHVPGTSSGKVKFSDLKVRTCRGCGYHTPSTYNTDRDSGRFEFEWVVEPESFRIWAEGT